MDSANNLIVKANTLIEARYKLTLNEQRILLYILADKVNVSASEFGVYKISRSELHSVYGMKNFDHIIEAVKKLRERKIQYRRNKKWLDAQWVSAALYDEENHEITIEFPQILKPYLLQLKTHFTSYKKENIAYLKSSYAIRLYELMKQYEKIGQRIFEIHQLKSTLSIDKNEYKLFGHFNDKVLKVCKDQINRNSDLHIEYKPIKKGRKYDSIEFVIKVNKQSKQAQNFNEYVHEQHEPEVKIGVDQKLHDDLIHHGLKPNQISEFLNDPNIGLDGIIEGFEYFKKKLADDKIHSNKPAYLAQSIQKKWGEKTPEEKADEQKTNDIETSRAIIKENKEILKSLEKDVSEYFDGKVSKIIESLDPDMKDGLEAECVSQLDSFKRKMFKDSERFRNTQFKGYIRERFVKESEEDVLEKISRKRKVDIVEVEGKISEAEGVLKRYGVVYGGVG